PVAFKIKVMEAEAKITTAREEEWQALNTSLKEDGRVALRISEPEGTRHPSASEADEED
ncbi:Zinc metalloproteinase nas-26, partial [Clarias magur]